MKNPNFSQITLGLVSAVLCLLGPATMASETYRWPEFCDQTELTILNKKNQTLELWLQERSPYLQSENLIKINGLSQHKMVLNSKQSYSLLNYEESRNVLNKDFSISAQCLDESFKGHFSAKPFEGGVHYFKVKKSEPLTLFLKNLHIEDTSFTIAELDYNQKEIKSEKKDSESLTTIKHQIIPSAKTSWIKVSANNKFFAFSIKSKAVQYADLVRAEVIEVDTQAIYFLAGHRSRSGENFVVKIIDPALIEKARDQIKNPQIEKIIFATIKVGHGNFNRDFSRKDKSFWSWSVDTVTNINDVAGPWCNGSPQLVEDVLIDWKTNPGSICFHTYRIKKELAPKEVSTGQLFKN